MSIDPAFYDRCIIRIPIAGQSPDIPGKLPANNTLVFIRAWLPATNPSGDFAPGGFQSFTDEEDTDVVWRGPISFDTLYGIDGYLHEHAAEYRDQTQISITAFLSTVDADTDETAFVVAVDSVSAEILDNGQLKVTVSLGEQEGDREVEVSMAVFVSVWLMTYEPHADFTAPPKRDLTGDDARILRYKDLIRAAPVPATQPWPSFGISNEPALYINSPRKPTIRVRPEQLRKDDTLWRVHLESDSGLVLPGLAGRAQRPLDPAAARASLAQVPIPGPTRPPWLSEVFLPPIAPRLPGVHTGVFAHDQQLSRDWPWCTIGRVFFGRSGTNFGRGSAGTGVMVGRNLLLTASHLVPWGQPAGQWWMEFVPAYALRGGKTDNEPFGSSYVEVAHGVRNDGDHADGLDVVICKLFTPLGDRCGWMGAESWSGEDPYYAGEWISVGYPESFEGGEVPAVEFARGIKDIDDEDLDGLALETVNFTDHGWSGGPLWNWIDGQPRVIGVCSGTETNLGPDRSVFAGGNHMLNLIKYGIANFS